MNFAEATKEKIYLLRAGIVLLVLVVAAISWSGYQTIQDFRASSRLLQDTLDVMEKIDSTLAAVRESERAIRDFVLTKDPEHLEPFSRSTALVHEHLIQLREDTRNDPVQQVNVDRLEALSEELARLAGKTFEQRNKSLAAALRVIKSDETKCLGEEIGALLNEMRAHEKQELKDRQTHASGRIWWTTLGCGLVLAADLGFLVWIAVLSYRLNRLHHVIKICAWTKKVEHEGQWITLEEYLQRILEAPVTHGICAEAAADLVADSVRARGAGSLSDPERAEREAPRSAA